MGGTGVNNQMDGGQNHNRWLTGLNIFQLLPLKKKKQQFNTPD